MLWEFIWKWDVLFYTWIFPGTLEFWFGIFCLVSYSFFLFQLQLNLFEVVSSNIIIINTLPTYCLLRLNFHSGKDTLGEFLISFFQSITTLLKLINFFDCDTLSPTLLDLFLSHNPSLCSTVILLPAGNADLVAA